MFFRNATLLFSTVMTATVALCGASAAIARPYSTSTDATRVSQNTQNPSQTPPTTQTPFEEEQIPGDQEGRSYDNNYDNNSPDYNNSNDREYNNETRSSSMDRSYSSTNLSSFGVPTTVPFDEDRIPGDMEGRGYGYDQDAILGISRGSDDSMSNDQADRSSMDNMRQSDSDVPTATPFEEDRIPGDQEGRTYENNQAPILGVPDNQQNDQNSVDTLQRSGNDFPTQTEDMAPMNQQGGDYTSPANQDTYPSETPFEEEEVPGDQEGRSYETPSNTNGTLNQGSNSVPGQTPFEEDSIPGDQEGRQYDNSVDGQNYNNGQTYDNNMSAPSQTPFEEEEVPGDQEMR